MEINPTNLLIRKIMWCLFNWNHHIADIIHLDHCTFLLNLLFRFSKMLESKICVLSYIILYESYNMIYVIFESFLWYRQGSHCICNRCLQSFISFFLFVKFLCSLNICLSLLPSFWACYISILKLLLYYYYTKILLRKHGTYLHAVFITELESTMLTSYIELKFR